MHEVKHIYILVPYIFLSSYFERVRTRKKGTFCKRVINKLFLYANYFHLSIFLFLFSFFFSRKKLVFSRFFLKPLERAIT